jgi:hypothetical protein
MANFRVQMDGLNELREQLRRLPEDLANEAGDIVLAHAEAAKREVESGYPYYRGVLRSRVRIERNRSKVTTSAIVRSAAPHAFIFEKGTVVRRNERGANRGRMPKAPEGQAAIPKFIRWRARMVEALKELIRSHGGEIAA